MPEQSNGVYVSTREIYDLLLDVRDDVREMKTSLTNNTDDVADLQSRVKSLEKRTLAFPASIVASILALVGAIITRLV